MSKIINLEVQADHWAYGSHYGTTNTLNSLPLEWTLADSE